MAYSVGICGDSGSGKTTLSKKIASYLGDCLVLECDRYHKWERGHPNWKNTTHLSLESNHIDQMKSDVGKLVNGKPIIRHDYDHSTGKFTSPKTIQANENLVVCGLHSLYCSGIFNINIYMDTEDDLRKFWKISRDTSSRGHTLSSVSKQIQERKEDFLNHVLPQKDWADLVVIFYSNSSDKVEIAKGIGTQLKLLVENTVPKNCLYKAYKDKGISVVISDLGSYNEVSFLSYPTSDVSYYYDHILVCVSEMLKHETSTLHRVHQ
jgi:uridine kinase